MPLRAVVRSPQVHVHARDAAHQRTEQQRIALTDAYEAVGVLR